MKKEYLTILTNIIGGVESGGQTYGKGNMVRMPEKQQMQTMKNVYIRLGAKLRE